MPVVHSVETALLALSSADQDQASVRNGAGFNQADSRFGHSLSRRLTGGKNLTESQYASAYKMLKTYQAQLLSGWGIDYDKIAPPANGTVTVTRTSKPRYVDFQGDQFVVVFPYDVEAREALKATVPGRTWDPDKAVWTVPAASAAPLGRWALAYKVGVREAALAVMTDSEPKHKPAVRIDEAIWKLSWATDADIEIPLPEGLEFHGFQKADIAYILKTLKPGKGDLLGDEMGLGKTPQAAVTLKLKEAYPAIITMPRVVWLKWAKELQMWTPGLRVVLLTGKTWNPVIRLIAKRFGAEVVRLGEELPEADVYLVKYSILYKWSTPTARKVANSKHKKRYTASGPLAKIEGVKGIVFDESHYLKEEGSQRTKAALGLVGTLKPDVRLALSGTAIPNRHREALTLLWLLDRLDAFAKDDWTFLNEFCNPHGPGNKGPFGHFEFDGSPNGDKFNRIARSTFMAQHEKKDHYIGDVLIPGVQNQLPAVVPDEVPADLTNQARYDAVHADLVVKRRNYAKALTSLKNAHANHTPAAQAKKLQGIVMGLENELGVLTNEARKVCGEEKIDYDIEWVRNWLDATEGTTDKLIVFGWHRSVNEAIRDAFGCPIIYGGQDEGTRQLAEDSFQEDPSVRLIVCQIEAAGVGINLTAATDIVFVEFSYVPKDFDQAIGRAYGRLNDAHGVRVTFLMYFSPDPDDPSIDEKVVIDMVPTKREVHSKAISGA